ncbi:site-specific DNA-methyltransferase [Leptolyngbya sp. 'hensonii']|uniref:DNA-methyltransferase n=1 Tax=Leptolyngbya sp. 'hensonii' TaxID=1922337 RepID=UPI00094F5557|nr:site-specific DNA-methyltransferase [Leptolyngbya sp. 'hensonii']OLP15622.1 site-specific DNA-methyltransferase [Leptolyngbya sp. 'hensonii']
MSSLSQTSQKKQRAPMNRTLTLDEQDKARLTLRILKKLPSTPFSEPPTGTIQGNCLEVAKLLPEGFVDLLVLDPPYNLNKSFNGRKFSRRTVDEYAIWLDEVVSTLKPLLKKTASIYICGDWLSSASIFTVASSHFVVQNRITWEREKGRGAKSNWKNSSEDIWFCTMSEDYTFNVDNVKLRRKVIAPYRKDDGTPKDWESTKEGNFRDTHPSNIWTDITIPFWSMPENTDHPTQKSEKLIAKLVLASTNSNDFVLDPFLGSGTTSVVAKKLGRKYLGIELDEEYSLLAEKRLEIAELEPEIQGFSDGVFWERNTLAIQQKGVFSNAKPSREQLPLLNF